MDRTKSAFISSYLFNTPFWVMFKTLQFILFKELGATPFEISMLLAVQPMVALASIYWSQYVKNRRDRLKSNIILGTIIGHLPFFFVPWVDNIWYFVFSASVYMLFQRGVIPAWMEVLKLNIAEEPRKKLFADVSTGCYVANALSPPLLGYLLDTHSYAWRWIFPIAALISLSAIIFQLRIPIPSKLPLDETSEDAFHTPWHWHVVRPWKEAMQLLRNRPDFLTYQWGFMLCGLGLMVIQPALPGFFMETLNMSYTELGTATTVCKGIGFAITSRLWAKWMGKAHIFRFLAAVTFVAALFPLALLAAPHTLLWVFAAYFIYGIMQAGSEMGWKLSGPIFSQDKDSSPYTSVNVLTVGMRGCIGPFIGSYLLISSGSSSVLWLCFALCITSTIYMCGSSWQYKYRTSHS